MSDHIWDFVGHEQSLVGQWPMTDSYLQPCPPLYDAKPCNFFTFQIIIKQACHRLGNGQGEENSSSSGKVTEFYFESG